jgi:hypothetical protein
MDLPHHRDPRTPDEWIMNEERFLCKGGLLVNVGFLQRVGSPLAPGFAVVSREVCPDRRSEFLCASSNPFHVLPFARTCF